MKLRNRLAAALFAALGSLVICLPAAAQWQVPSGAYAIGRGSGTGFNSLLCGSAQLAVGQAAAAPICRDLSGDITINSSGVTAIGTNKVTDAMIRQSGALALIGRSANSTGNVADIQASAGSSCAFRESSNTVACGTLATAAYADASVTDAKISNRTALSLFGRSANSSGVGADIAASAGSSCAFRESSSTVACGTLATAAYADASVTDAKISNRTALSLFGRSANSSGVGADIAASAGSSCAFRESSSTIACGTLATAAFAANSVTNAKLATMAQSTIKGRAVSAGTGDPTDLTATQATAILDGCVGDSGSGGTKGLVPAPGAGDAAAAKYLKADCTWGVPAGGGGGGMTDSERQNSLLNLIYQSKLFGDLRRSVNLFATGFNAATDTLRGINAGSSSNYTATPTSAQISYVAPSATETRFASGTTSSPIFSVTSGSTANLNDNDTGTTMTVSLTNVAGASVANTRVAMLDLGSAMTITKIEAKQVRVNTSSGSSTAGLYHSLDGSSWTQAGSLFGWNTTPTDRTASGLSVSARYVAVTISPENWAGVNGIVADLNVYTNAANDMVLVSTSQTADASVSSGRVLLEYDNTASPTLNTDLTAEVTCNNGSNWASASLSAVTSNSQGGRKVAESVDQACTSGTSFAARLKTFNAKSVPIYGLSLTVH